MRATLLRLLTSVAALALIWAAAIGIFGGFTFTLAGVHIASNSAWRPLAGGVILLALLFWVQGPGATVKTLLGAGRYLSAGRVAAGLAVVATVIGLRFGTWTAGGPDPFAYLSQAMLWRTGQLDIPVPLARTAPWPDAMTTFTPLGYRPSSSGAARLVPVTPPGLPLLMAAADAIAGRAGPFLITPLAGGALVLLTFGLGRRTASASAGLVAAWLVATSPALLFMLMWPMTDVLTAAAAAMTTWLLIRPSTRAAAVAGLTASAGVLIRPTFALLVLGAIAWLALEHWTWRPLRARWRLTAFVLGLLPGIAIAAWVNAHWYGSPFVFGYGSTGQILSMSRVLTNAARYSRWLAETSPLGLLGLAALAWFAAAPHIASDRRRAFSLLAIVAVCAWVPYLLYETFDDWWYLRFLLPAWPAMFVGTAALFDAVRTRGHLAAALTICVALAAGIAGAIQSRQAGVFAFNERRYATIARMVDAATDPNAVIFTVQHSGTIQYYAGRLTLRWDWLDPAWLDRAIDWLSAQGRHPYLLIEDWEEPRFESKFGGSNRSGRLSFSPALAWQSVRADGWIFLFDPLNRDAVTLHPGPEVERTEPFCPVPAANPWPR